jgi:hypothetical protein
VAGGPASGLWQLYAFDRVGPGIGGSIAGGWTLDLTTQSESIPAKRCKKAKKKRARAAKKKRCKKKKKNR